MRTCIVIGAGAAGMMAAIHCASADVKVIILEKNEKPGKKLFITGKGRCNVTNDCDAEEFFRNVISNPKFLYSAYYSFDSSAVMQLMEENGCRLKIERGNRVFPQSDHSSDIIKTLQLLLKKKNVEIQHNISVKSIMTEENKVTGVILENGKRIPADYVVLATGGKSYPLTGSTGDGYDMAESLGHTITTIKPALIPLVTKEHWVPELMGLSLKNVQITMYDGKKKLYDGFGEMLFTHFGVSGPLILSASSIYVKKAYEKEIKLNLDLKPALSHEQLDKRILRDFEERSNKQFKNALDGLLPAKMIPVIIDLSNIEPDKPVHEVTRQERKGLVELMKALTMTVIGTRPVKEAIITQGGIQVKEVNPSTMESKLVENLYVAGEVLDVDALTGGFNLQIAWSTGYLAGSSIAEKAQKDGVENYE